MSFIWMVAVLAVVWGLAYFRSPLWLWTLSLAAVNQRPRTKSGKYRFLDQRLPIQYGDRP